MVKMAIDWSKACVFDVAVHREYERADRALYGTHIFSRFWCQRVRPWLQPGVHRELGDRWDKAAARQKENMIARLFCRAGTVTEGNVAQLYEEDGA